MAMIPENPVVGGTVLRRAAIQSPNFVTGSSGWSVNQDGSAEFNNIVIRNGQIVSGTALYYSGAPALGNLVASVAAAAGTDSKGNAYLAGVTDYTNLGGTFFASSQQGGAYGLWSAPAAGGPWTAYGTYQMLGGGTTDIYIQSISGNLLLQAPGAGKAISLQAAAVALAGLQVTGGLTTDTETITSAHTAASPLLEIINTASSITPLIRATINALGDLLFGGRLSGDTNSRIVIDITAGGLPRIRFGSGTAAPDTAISRTAANTLAVNTADLDIATVGRGLQVAEGINGRMATAGLVGGTITVPNTTVTANTRIFLTVHTPGGTPGFLRVSSRIAGTSFTILSSSSSDTSLVAWLMIEPG